ncbi:MAG: hypothetical protein V1874_06220 [Spirochaetota bacterium]
MRRIRKYLTLLFIILLYFNNQLSADNEDNGEPQKQYKHYEDIKRKQNQDFKKGIYKDEKKDYVKKWISEDINYQKRVIQLKNDYLTWAKQRINAGKEVKFNEYEGLKNLSKTEKEVLWEYHNSHFKSKEKSKSGVTSNAERRKTEKIKQKKPEGKIETIVNKEDKLITAVAAGSGSAEIENRPDIYLYIVIGAVFLIITGACAYLILHKFIIR